VRGFCRVSWLLDGMVDGVGGVGGVGGRIFDRWHSKLMARAFANEKICMYFGFADACAALQLGRYFFNSSSTMFRRKITICGV